MLVKDYVQLTLFISQEQGALQNRLEFYKMQVVAI